ncbi:MAG: RDD family protein [Acidimicrobiales bacterium]
MSYPAHYDVRQPTDVVGKRIGAYLLDGLFRAAVIVVFLVFVLHHSDQGGEAGKRCSDALQAKSAFCVQIDANNAYYLAKSDAWKMIIFSAAWFVAIEVLLQGLVGGTLGKLIVGIRAVKPDGSICGPWRAFLRSLPFAASVLSFTFSTSGGILAIGYVGTALVLIEFVVLLSRKDHRRLGDQLADTAVVDKHAVGHEIPLGGALASGWAGGAGPWPGAWGPANESLPQWDQAREAYIWWDTEQHQWLEHDPATGEWRPIGHS